jgi:hypothetical protein
MPKVFYTERDIEDLFRSGVTSLEIADNVVLTELAYEKAGSLGMKLISGKPDNPPCAPVRPYIARMHPACAAPGPAASAVDSRESPKVGLDAGQTQEPDLAQRIRTAVIARLGNQVDSGLLDVIIRRVLASTGVK